MLIVIHFNPLRSFFYTRASKLRPEAQIRPARLFIRPAKPFPKIWTAGQMRPANTFC